MEEEALKKGPLGHKGFGFAFILALVFSLFDFFYTFLINELGLRVEDIFEGSYLLVRPKIIQILSTNFEVLPLIVFWILVGAIAYFFYFSLEVMYYDINYYLDLKKIPHFFGGVEDPRRLRIIATRALVHLLVAVFYLLLIATIYLFIVPVTRLLYLYLDSTIPALDFFPVALLGPVAIWFAVFVAIFYFYGQVTKSLKDERYWEEHNLTA